MTYKIIHVSIKVKKYGKNVNTIALKGLINTIKNIEQNNNLDEYVFIDDTINYFVGSMISCNDDSYMSPSGRNYYIYQEKQKITLLPYDLDLCFIWSNSINKPVLFYDMYTYTENKPLIYNILSNEKYKKIYKQKLIDTIDLLEKDNYIGKRIETYENLIEPSITNNKNNVFDKETIEQSIEKFKKALYLRFSSIRKQVDANKDNVYIQYEEEIGIF